jgi:hypothetical protein
MTAKQACVLLFEEAFAGFRWIASSLTLLAMTKEAPRSAFPSSLRLLRRFAPRNDGEAIQRLPP